MHSFNKIVPSGKNGKLLLLGVAILAFVFFGGQIMKFFKKLFGTLGNAVTGDTQVSIDKVNHAQAVFDQAAHDFNFAGLPHSRSFYQQVAESQFTAMESMGTDFDSMYKGVKDLSARELMAVYYCYGLRQIALWGTTDSIKKDLLQAYNDELTSWSVFGKSELEKMQEVWNKTAMKI
jgi:hypothetical protein